MGLACFSLRNTGMWTTIAILSLITQDQQIQERDSEWRAWPRHGSAAAWAALNREFYLKASEDGRMSFNLGAPCKHGHRFLLSLGKGAPIFLSSRIERLSTMRALRLRLPSGRIQFFERTLRGRIRRVSETFSQPSAR